MSDRSDHDFVRHWIEAASHHPGCTAVIASAENCCSCGKKEAIAATITLDPEGYSCDGDCETADDYSTLIGKLKAMISHPGWKHRKREDVKAEIETLI